MTNDVRRLLHELLARVNALEAWRAHQSDLLDAVINNSSSPSAEKVSDDDPLDIVLDADQLVGWVHQHVAAVIARPLRGEYRWCPIWWEHPEAAFRFAALQRAWAELAPEPGSAMSVWIRDHLDPCLRELLSPTGPFVDCIHDERYRTLNEHRPHPTLPVVDPKVEP
ncbi:DUF4913 domain-containing protein [Pseudonocardia sp. 73-21]|uniref:DUF4913 domain-containing protein n=1 Tax=Pseudonocardia sp. 73-21 TaxID=1895809 RepID=UPI00095F61B8|nr:DUF4913 domain-containing protein [Pseudonocardia sp. 73-21]OJY41596.1 MAG: hypothetical protein BGP03_20585 [Pseudonocardia sp. 73-21]